MANIKDVAKRAGVSVTTVSRVINNIDLVNPETKQAVEKAMEELQYVPNQLARGMRTKRTQTIGIIIPEFVNSFYHELFQYIEEEAAALGYTILVSSTREESGKSDEHIKDLVSRKIDGIILCTYRGDEGMMRYLEEVGKAIPVIFLDNLGQEFYMDAVYTDGFNAMKEMVFHLTELGHQRIGFIRGLDQYSVANDRYAGFRNGMEEKGLKFRDQYVFKGNYRLESGYHAGKYFATECATPPSAIIAASDLMAIGAMNYYLSKGMEIPKDIAVAGYDNISLGKLMIPPLTTIAQPTQEIARRAIDLIIEKIQYPHKQRRRIIVEGKLKIRRSTDLNKPHVLDLGTKFK